MPVRKQNISLPADIADAIDRRAAVAGVTFSAWLADAARRQLRREAGLAGVAEWEAEHGLLPEDPVKLVDMGDDGYVRPGADAEVIEKARRAAAGTSHKESARTGSGASTRKTTVDGPTGSRTKDDIPDAVDPTIAPGHGGSGSAGNRRPQG